MKIFAYYLPQFHCIPENDKWWGKGFTEWTNVKKSKPLFNGHLQPKIPLKNNYYCLDNVDTLYWQSNLLSKYKVDGLIFYHYYFKGKKLLEKPAELLLKNKDININYFFCWANHSWIKSWQGKKDLLMEQTYGNMEDWNNHFNYLLPFFKDSRYQKKNNRPIIMIFNSNFKEKNELFKFLNKKCIDNGFDGICLVETFNKYISIDNSNSDILKISHFREPTCSLHFYSSTFFHFPIKLFNYSKKILANNNFKVIKKYNGDKLFKIMIDKYYHDDMIIRGLFFEWDNTPRHGYRGYIISPPKKDTFMKYMDVIKNDEFVFVNAWNEWAEGMMLEPTEVNGYKYLEWIKEWKENENRSNRM